MFEIDDTGYTEKGDSKAVTAIRILSIEDPH